MRHMNDQDKQLPRVEEVVETWEKTDLDEEKKLDEKVFDMIAAIKKDKKIDVNAASSYAEMFFHSVTGALGDYVTDKKTLSEALKFYRVLKQRIASEMDYLQRTYTFK